MRGSLTLGRRWFDRRLDAGLIVRYNRGLRDDSTLNSPGGTGAFYVADWPEYARVDLYASYRLSSHLKLSASVENGSSVTGPTSSATAIPFPTLWAVTARCKGHWNIASRGPAVWRVALFFCLPSCRQADHRQKQSCRVV